MLKHMILLKGKDEMKVMLIHEEITYDEKLVINLTFKIHKPSIMQRNIFRKQAKQFQWKWLTGDNEKYNNIIGL